MPDSQPTSVTIQRQFDAAPAAVWRAWTTPEQIRGWFGSDPAGTVIATRLDVRPGGEFEIRFQDSDGTVHTCRGVYREVQPTTHLSFSWSWESEPGFESSVDVALRALGARTEMTFEHADLGSASLHDYGAGWRRTFDKLARVLSVQS